jgi:hypothetical protein
MKLEFEAPSRNPWRTIYAIGYCLLYGLLPVFWWGAREWKITAALVLGMASLQMLLFYVSAKRDAARRAEPSRLEQIAWPLAHGGILAGYFFSYYKLGVIPSAA